MPESAGVAPRAKAPETQRIPVTRATRQFHDARTCKPSDFRAADRGFVSGSERSRMTHSFTIRKDRIVVRQSRQPIPLVQQLRRDCLEPPATMIRGELTRLDAN